MENNIDLTLESLGQRKSIVGDFNVFKLKINDRYYKIEIINKKIRVYTYNTKFEKIDLDYYEMKKLKKELNKQKQQQKFKTTEISKEFLEDLFKENYSYVPKETIIEEPIRKEGEFYYNEINNILDHLNVFDYEGTIKIDESFCQKINDNRLLNYSVKVEIEGDHKNDGQLVEYTFIFKSPKGKETTLYTEMCLMVGWNYHKSIIIS